MNSLEERSRRRHDVKPDVTPDVKNAQSHGRVTSNPVSAQKQFNFQPKTTVVENGNCVLVSRGDLQCAKAKRDSYRVKSSGYGTGSSEGSCDKTHEMCENEVFEEDIYTASGGSTGASRNKTWSRLSDQRGRSESSHRLMHSANQSLTSESSASANSNDTVIDKKMVFPGEASSMNDEVDGGFRNFNRSQPNRSERMLSDQELSFEIQISAGSIVASPAEPQPQEPPHSSNTDYDSLFEDPALLREYISEQHNTPVYAPNTENTSAISTSEPHPALNISPESSYFTEDVSISSIIPSMDGHVPVAVMERMYSSAMGRLDRQNQQQDLQRMLSEVEEEDTVDDLFNRLGNLSLDSDILESFRTARSDMLPSNMDTVDRLLRQIAARGEGASPTVEGAGLPESLDLAQYMYNLPEHYVVSPLIASAAELEVDPDLLLQRLQMAALCLDTTCNHVECSIGQELLEHLEDRLEQNLTYESASCQLMLKTIACHADLCEEIKCPLPYCQFFQETDIPFEEQIARLQQTLYSGFYEITEPWSQDDSFWKISARIPVDKPLQEGVDWSHVSRMGSFGRGPYLVKSSYNLDISDYWVVKKISNNEEASKMVDNVKKLSDDNIIHLLWLMRQESCLYVCSQFEGMSVSECLKLKEFERGLGRETTLCYLLQLISAVRYLHKKNTLYLNWTGDHIIVDNDVVKLCNLTTVVPSNEDYDEDMLEDVMMTLPPHVLPPELLALKCVSESSDIWGLGCIVYEMYSGFKVHNHLRHQDLSSQRSEISKNPAPDLKDVKDGKLLNVLNSCFQVNHEERPSLSALEALTKRLTGGES